MSPLFILGLINIGFAVYWGRRFDGVDTFSGIMSFFCGVAGVLALSRFLLEKRVIISLYLKAFRAMFFLFIIGVRNGRLIKTVKIVWGLWRTHRSLHKIMQSPGNLPPANRAALERIAHQWNVAFNDDEPDDVLRERIRRGMILTLNRPIPGTTQE